jgi:uncharacterized protein YozE (UPF0346 family)
VRHYFSDLTRPKSSAKRLSKQFAHKALHETQHAIAVAVGYADWHELEKAHTASPPSLLDQDLALADFHERSFTIIDKIAKALEVPDGDVQYAISRSHLMGDRRFTFEDHETLRTRFWRASAMPWLGKHRVGSTFITKDKGTRGERAYQSHSRVVVRCVADFYFQGGRAKEETRTPRDRMADFVPMRLWLPYGFWTCKDGSEVLYSRDYMPMWRLRDGAKPERLDPWLWISDIAEHTFFGIDGMWHTPQAIAAAKAKLATAGITALPVLADALPTLVNVGDFGGKEVVEAMKKLYGTERKTYYAPVSPHLHLAANSFVDFVMSHPGANSPAGDFIGDAKQDPTFPSAKSWRELQIYLESHGAASAAIASGRLVWKAYKA